MYCDRITCSRAASIRCLIEDSTICYSSVAGRKIIFKNNFNKKPLNIEK